MSDPNLPDDANADQGAQPTQAPQPPTPTPSVRLSIHTVTPPIPARRTSITASETGSYTLRSPFTFGGFGPSTLPDPVLRRQSDLIRDAINTAYAQGRKDGSRYGSIGGSQIIHVEGSHTPWPTTSQLVRDQQGITDPSMLWDETDVNFPPLPKVPLHFDATLKTLALLISLVKISPPMLTFNLRICPSQFYQTFKFMWMSSMTNTFLLLMERQLPPLQSKP